MDTQKPNPAPVTGPDNPVTEEPAPTAELEDIRRMLLRRIEVLEAAITRLSAFQRTHKKT